MMQKSEGGDNGVARCSTQLDKNEETLMLIDRHHLWGLLLALLSVAAGMALLGQGAPVAAREFIQLLALLLIIYGLIVAWWHTQRAISVFEVRTARAVHRALNSARGRRR
jgi:hypothetical protein